jgi:phospholipid/cholesterol/gamma-HCH transport system substrate-binding protein
MIRRVLVLATVAVIVAVIGLFAFRWTRDYQLSLVLPAASNLVVGSPIQIKGRSAGEIEEVHTEDDHAVVRVIVNREYAPLHDGTTARIRWQALLGERVLEVLPGPVSNPVLPDGALVVGALAPVEFDDVLSALDPATRARLTSLVHQVDGTLDGRQKDLNDTLRTAGPAIGALGRVVEGIGADGPAIAAVVRRLDELTRTVADRRSDVSGVVQHLAQTGAELAQRRTQLRDTLRELPSTLAEARATLDRVPEASDATLPLLAKLRPSTSRLPAIARNLSPLLADLRPAVADLRPTLQAADRLLEGTPGLLDGAHSVFPQLTDTLRSSRNAVAFLRPYTPEIAGTLANFGSFPAAVDGNGHYARLFAPEGGASLTNNPGVLPPGLAQDRAPLPGSLEGQPWTDATGRGIR